MQEYVTRALVLDSEPARENDRLVFLYTEALGLVKAKARAARKITSKLASHIEPGRFIQARLVEKNGFQIVDALAEKNFIKSPLNPPRLSAEDESGAGFNKPRRWRGEPPDVAGVSPLRLIPEGDILRTRETLAALKLIRETAVELHPDKRLWEVINSGRFQIRELLSVLGFDLKFARCHSCGQSPVRHFLPGDGWYLCERCFRKISGATKTHESVSLRHAGVDEAA